MKIGFVRLSKAGPAYEEQIAALAKAGVSSQATDQHVFVDDQCVGRGVKEKSALREAIALLNDGDELVVSTLSRIGSNYTDALETIISVCERRASIFIVDTKQLISMHIMTYELLQIAASVEHANRVEIAEKMKLARAASGSVGGAPDKLTGDLLDKAKMLWADSSLTADEVAARVGVARRTLYRRFGPRS